VYPADVSPPLLLSTIPEGAIKAQTVGWGDGVLDGSGDELTEDDVEGNLLGDTLGEEEAVSETVCPAVPANARALNNKRSIYIYTFFGLGFGFTEYLPSSNKMSADSVPAVTTVPAEVVPAPVTVEAPVVVDVPVPAPAPAVDFSDNSALLKFALMKIAEAQLQADVAIDDKIKQVVEAIKTEIRKADLSPTVRVAALDWCDDALPYVIKAVDIIQAELKKVALTEADKVKDVVVAEVKKCCPSFFTKKV